MEDDWDLQAVVRSCATTTTAATSSSTSTTATSTNTNTNTTGYAQFIPSFHQEYNFSSQSQDLFEPRRGDSIEELHDLYKPFFPTNKREDIISQTVITSKALPISPLSVLGGLQDLASSDQNQQQVMINIQQAQIRPKQQPFSVINGSKASGSNNSRSKRRKNNMKRVCHVAAESLSSDMWSWRKYGQKPIKGSPYPRGYYRCSTSKGCMARKQVERNRSDPGMFIVTYTGEHNHPMPTHRNSLAGSTRQKPAETPNSDDLNKPCSSTEMSPAAAHSPAVEKLESSREDLAEAEDEEDEFSVSDMPLDDDFFTGLEDFTGPDMGECFSDNFPASLSLPWLENSATTATSSG